MILPLLQYSKGKGRGRGVCKQTLFFSPALFAQKATPKKLAVTQLEQILEQKAKVNQGEAKFTAPQNDLDVTVDGFLIISPMGMGSWAALSPTPKGAMLMDDIVIQENEIRPVQRVVLENGLSITAIHNHFMRDEPKVMYMHIRGMGSQEQLAQGVKAVIDKVLELRWGDPAQAKAVTAPNTLETE